MAVFSYQAVDLDRSSVAGTIVADTPREARDQLRARGLTIQQVTSTGTARSGSGGGTGHRWLHRSHPAKTVAFIRELSTLLGAGIPLLDSLDTIARQQRGAFRQTVLLLHDGVASGRSLAEAMREQPVVFDDLCVHLVEVGEHAGHLEQALDELASFRERSLALRGRVGTALLYPCIVLFIGTLVGLFLMSFVVPKLLESLVEAGRPLPWATRIVKSISDILMQQGWLIALVAALLAMLMMILRRTTRAKRMWHRLQLRLPLIGDLIRKQAIVRIATVMATLLRSGIVFERAIQIAQQTTGNLVLRAGLARCEKAIHAGGDIAPALEASGAFPPTVVQIFAVGQQSGRLEEMLDRLATDYDRQVNTAAQRLSAVLEPILIVLLAFFVGFIAFATVLPILEAGKVL